MWQQLNLLAKRGPVHVFTVGHNATKLETMPLATSWEHVETSTHRSRFWPGPAKLARVLFPPQYFGVGDFADRAINARLHRFIDRTNMRAYPEIQRDRYRRLRGEWKSQPKHRREPGALGRILDDVPLRVERTSRTRSGSSSRRTDPAPSRSGRPSRARSDNRSRRR